MHGPHRVQQHRLGGDRRELLYVDRDPIGRREVGERAGLVGGLRWWVPWNPMSTRPWIGLGYRAISCDHEFSAGNQANLEFRGPYSALGVAF